MKALKIISAMLLGLFCCPESYCDGAVEVHAGTLTKVTAYCPCSKCCGRSSDGITASGHVIRQGDRFVAAPPEIAFGTFLNVPGYGRVPVLDRGGAIKGNRLDVYFDTHQEALNWGVQWLKIKMK